MIITDLQNNVVYSKDIANFKLENTPECYKYISDNIDSFLDDCPQERSKIIGLGFAITCRVNSHTGHSHKYFSELDKPLAQSLEDKLGLQVLLENDTRARCYAEYCSDNNTECKNFIYLNAGRGVGIGIVIDGKLYYGKSGISGEFGHTPFFDNDIICACGKKGCLETEISGIALERQMTQAIENGVNTILKEKYDKIGKIHINDIIEAAKNDDTLSIELLESAAEKIGKSLAFLINIFNPELVKIGGNLANAGDTLMLPVKSGVNKYSLGFVVKDTIFDIANVKNSAALGSAMLIRNKIIGL